MYFVNCHSGKKRRWNSECFTWAWYLLGIWNLFLQLQ